MKAKTKINYKNLRLLVSRLEEQLDSPTAARFNMRHFGSAFIPGMTGHLPETYPICKTQACLAGETVLATGRGQIAEQGGIVLNSEIGNLGTYKIAQVAQEDLGLNNDQARRLFFFKGWYNWINRKNTTTGWPTKFEEMYNQAKTPQGRLYVAIQRVNHFIKTKGRQ